MTDNQQPDSTPADAVPVQAETVTPMPCTAATYMLGFHGELWAIDRTRAEAYRRMAITSSIAPDEIEARTGPPKAKVSGMVAVLPVMGPMVQRASLFSALFGGTSTERWGQAFDELVANDNVGAIIGLFDTPGGIFAGTPELAEKVYAARGTKPLVAVADPWAASAGYHLASAFDQIVVIRSGQVGALSVTQAHEDVTELEAKLGIKTTFISGAPYKTEEFPEVPLTEEAKAEMQSRVDEFQAMVERDVAKYRGVPLSTVRRNFGQGRLLRAKKAVEVGMADSIGTLEQTVRSLGGRLAEVATVRASAEEKAREVAKLEGNPNAEGAA